MVGLLWQCCHTLFFQKAFLANAKGHSLSLGHVLTHTLHPREELNPPSVCPKPALALLALLLMLMKSEDQLSLANSALSWPLRPA